jgi:hypothetical protein
MDVGATDEDDSPDSERAAQAPEPREAKIGLAVEIIARLLVIPGALAYLVAVFIAIGSIVAPSWAHLAWVTHLAYLLICGAFSWHLLADGLLLSVASRLMAGTTAEALWRASTAPHWVAGLLLVCSGVCWAILTKAAWAAWASAMGVSIAPMPSPLTIVLFVGGIAPSGLLLTGSLWMPLLVGRRSNTTETRPQS